MDEYGESRWKEIDIVGGGGEEANEMEMKSNRQSCKCHIRECMNIS